MLLEKIAARKRKVCVYSKKWFRFRLFKDDYFDPICSFSPCWQYAGNILGLILFSLLILALQRSGLKSWESPWPLAAELFFPSFVLAWLRRACQMMCITFPEWRKDLACGINRESLGLGGFLVFNSPILSQPRSLFINVFWLAVLGPCALRSSFLPQRYY